MNARPTDGAAPRPMPSLVSLVLNDRLLFIAVIGPVVFWGLHGLLFLASRLDREPPPPILIPLIATAIGIVVSLLKLSGLRRVIRLGVLARGMVTDCRAYKTGFRVAYTFEADGIRTNGSATSTLVHRAHRFPVGEGISVLYDRSDSRRSLPWDLFVDGSPWE